MALRIEKAFGVKMDTLMACKRLTILRRLTNGKIKSMYAGFRSRKRLPHCDAEIVKNTKGGYAAALQTHPKQSA
jgi:hypothetical protein